MYVRGYLATRVSHGANNKTDVCRPMLSIKKLNIENILDR